MSTAQQSKLLASTATLKYGTLLAQAFIDSYPAEGYGYSVRRHFCEFCDNAPYTICDEISIALMLDVFSAFRNALA